MITRLVSTARAKNAITSISPSIRSPISLAKPITWMRYCPLAWYWLRSCSSFCEKAW
ncbi:hypothetical protein D9M71_688900 [compost metagenome]